MFIIERKKERKKERQTERQTERQKEIITKNEIEYLSHKS
jgi:hypothetical protein